MLVTSVLDVFFTLDEVSERCVDHVGYRRVVLGAAGDNLTRFLEQLLALVAESEGRPFRRHINECAYGGYEPVDLDYLKWVCGIKAD